MHTRSYKNKQAGVSLVSLMIGVGLSVFLIAVLLQIFSSSRSNYTLVENIASMDDSMNFVASTMMDIIPYAGHRAVPSSSDPLPDMTVAFPGEPNIENAQAGIYVMPLTSATGKDGFTIAYQGHDDGYIKDCHGNVVESGEVAYLTFKQVAGDGRDNSLICERYAANKSTEMISKVLDQFWIRYGEDVNGNGNIDRYLTAAQKPDYSKVKAIQIAVLLHTPEEVFPTEREFKFVKWGEVITRKDKYLYKFMTFTFPLSHTPGGDNAVGGTILTDSLAATQQLPFKNYNLPPYYFNNTKTFTGNSITHDGSTNAPEGTVAFISPFIEASSRNADKEIYVEYYIGSKGTGENIYFCHFFEGITKGGVGYDEAKLCYHHTESATNSNWGRMDCSSEESIVALDDGKLEDGDIIGMSIRFPTAIVKDANIETKLYRNGANIYAGNSNGSLCQVAWNKAIANQEKVVFAVGEFWMESGMMQFTLNKPPWFKPNNAEALQ